MNENLSFDIDNAHVSQHSSAIAQSNHENKREAFLQGNIDIHQTIEYMQNNISVPMTIKALAEHLGTTTSHLDTSFSTTVGMTPSFVWRKLRLEKACWLLINTQQKIIDIALACGYYDSAHFNKIFKSSYSISPKKIRSEGIRNLNIKSKVSE